MSLQITTFQVALPFTQNEFTMYTKYAFPQTTNEQSCYSFSAIWGLYLEIAHHT